MTNQAGEDASIAQEAERILGKDEVGSSNLPGSSNREPAWRKACGFSLYNVL